MIDKDKLKAFLGMLSPGISNVRVGQLRMAATGRHTIDFDPKYRIWRFDAPDQGDYPHRKTTKPIPAEAYDVILYDSGDFSRCIYAPSGRQPKSHREFRIGAEDAPIRYVIDGVYYFIASWMMPSDINHRNRQFHPFGPNFIMFDQLAKGHMHEYQPSFYLESEIVDIQKVEDYLS